MENKLLIQDLAEAIATKEGITKKKSEAFVKALFETIEEGLIADKFVKIKGLGTFKIISVGERESVNINTGERFSIEGHDKITFTPDTVLKDLVNRPFAHFQTVILNEDTDTEELENVENEPEDELEVTETEEKAEQEEIEDSATTAPENEKLEPETKDTEKIESTNSVDEAKADEIQEVQATEEVQESQEPVAPTEEPETTVSPDATTNVKSSHNQAVTEEPVTENETEKEIVAQEEVFPISEETNRSAPETTETVSTVDQEPTEEVVYNETTEVATDTNNQPNEENNTTVTVSAEKDNTSQEPATENVKYIIKELEGKRNVWKTTALVLLSILLLMLSYFAGYFRWFCPCELTQKYLGDPPPTPAATIEQVPINPDTVKTDSIIKTEIPNNTSKDSLVTTEIITETSKTNPPKREKPQEKPIKNTPSPYKQVAGGKYEIVGTIGTHQIKSGETIRTIALDVYGSKGYALYIITHNSITAPDNIEIGTVIKLPKLKRRNAVK